MFKRATRLEEVLARCLEQIEAGESPEVVLARYPAQASRIRPEIEAALWLRGRAHLFDPRPGFIQASRPHVVAAVRRERLSRQGFSWEWLKQWLLGKRVARLALAFVVVVMMTFATQEASLAAGRSLPGEPLYAVKTFAEDVQLAISQSESQDVQLYIQFASRRVDEIQQLILEGRYDAVPIATLRFEQQVRPAAQLLRQIAKQDPEQTVALAASFSQMVEKQSLSLQALSVAVPETVSVEIQAAVSLSEREMDAVMALTSEVPMKPSPAATPSSTLTTTAEGSKTPTVTASSSPTLTETLVGLPSETSAPSLEPSGTITPTAVASSTPEATATPKFSHTPKPPNTHKPPTNTPKPPNTNKPPTEEKEEKEKPTKKP